MKKDHKRSSNPLIVKLCKNKTMNHKSSKSKRNIRSISLLLKLTKVSRSYVKFIKFVKYGKVSMGKTKLGYLMLPIQSTETDTLLNVFNINGIRIKI